MDINGLGFVPFPFENESPTSAIQRAIRANGFRDYSSFIKVLSKGHAATTASSPLYATSSIAEALKACAPKLRERLESNFYVSANSVLSRSDTIICDVVIKWRFIRHSNVTAFCSECYKSGYERFTKDIKLFFYCPYHCRQFLQTCPNCFKKLSWKLLLTGHCKCGHHLVSPKANKSTVAAENYLLELITDKSQEQLDLIQNILIQLENTTKTNIDRLLIERRNLAISISQVDIKSIAKAMRGLLPCSNAEQIELSLSLIDSFLPKHALLRLKSNLIRATATPQQQLAEVRLHKTELLHYLGLTHRVWGELENHQLFENMLLPRTYNDSQATTLKQRVGILISDGFLPTRKAATDKTDSLSLDMVASLTNLPKAAIRQLSTKSTLLSSDMKPRRARRWPVFNPKAISYYNKTYICSQRLADELKTSKTAIQQIIDNLGIEIPASKPIYSTMIIKQSDRELLEREIIAFRTAKPPRWSRLNSLPAAKKSLNLLTVLECSKILRTSIKTTRSLTAINGPIPVNFKSECGEYLLKKEDILAFQRTFVTSQEASRLTGVSLHKLFGHLESLGVHRVCGELKTGNGGYYRLADLINQKNLSSKEKTPNRTLDSTQPVFDNPVSEICHNSNLTNRDFVRIFLTSKLFKYRYTRRELYLTAPDAEAISNILKDHITYRAADRLLDAPRNYTYTLIKRAKILNDNLGIIGLVPYSIVLEYKKKQDDTT